MTQGYSGEETTLQMYFAKQQDGQLEASQQNHMKTGEKGILEQYNAIIKDQLAKNIVELVGEHMVG